MAAQSAVRTEPASFQHLPNELCILIGKNLPVRSLNSYVRCNKTLYELLNRTLYQRGANMSVLDERNEDGYEEDEDPYQLFRPLPGSDEDYLHDTEDLLERHPVRPLHWAARHGVLTTTHMLLDNGADANFRVHWPIAKEIHMACWTPLSLAIRFGHIEVAMLLLNAAPLPFPLPDDGRHTPCCTSLHHAIAANNTALITALLDKTRCMGGIVPVRPSDFHGRVPREISAVYPSKWYVNVSDCDSRSPLHLALLHCPPSTFDLLVAAGAQESGRSDLDEGDPLALHITACFGKLPMLRHLLGRGHDPNALDNNRETPLVACARCPESETAISLLLGAGGDPNAATPPMAGYTTPLFEAFSPAKATLLLDAGAKLDHADIRGRTAAHALIVNTMYCKTTQQQLVTTTLEVLLERGTKVNALTECNCTLLDLAEAVVLGREAKRKGGVETAKSVVEMVKSYGGTKGERADLRRELVEMGGMW